MILQSYQSTEVYCIVNILVYRNPRVDSIPPAIATLRRLWEVKVDDMKKAIEQFQPKGENVASGILQCFCSIRAYG